MEEQQVIIVCSDCKSYKRTILDQAILPFDFNKFCVSVNSKCEECGSIGITNTLLVNLNLRQNFENKIQNFYCNNCGNYSFIDVKNIQDHPTTDVNSQYFNAKCLKCGQRVLLINYSSKDALKLSQVMNDKEEQQKIKNILRDFERNLK